MQCILDVVNIESDTLPIRVCNLVADILVETNWRAPSQTALETCRTSIICKFYFSAYIHECRPSTSFVKLVRKLMDALQPDFRNKDSKRNGDWRVGIEAKHYYYTLENIPRTQIHLKPNENPRVIDHYLSGRDYGVEIRRVHFRDHRELGTLWALKVLFRVPTPKYMKGG